MEFKKYQESLNAYRDVKNSIDWAEEKAKLEVAKKLLENGVDVDIIVKSTGLSLNDIEKFKKT